MKCQVCEGSGKQTITAVTIEYGKPPVQEKPVQIDCIWCEGTGEMTEIQAFEFRKFQNAWCKCGNPSGETRYYHEKSGAHGWECCDCGKIVQAG